MNLSTVVGRMGLMVSLAHAFTCAFCLVALIVLSACTSLETPQQTQGMVATQDPTRIELNQPLHFSAPDGSDVVVQRGAYRVEQATSTQIRIVSTGDASSTLIGAQALASETKVTTPIALVMPAAPDAFDLVLLVPNSLGLEAHGLVTGVQSRGLPLAGFRPPLTGVRMVPRPPGPDLFTSLITMSLCGGPASIVVTNSGTEAAGASTTRVAGKELATFQTNTLAPGQSQHFGVVPYCRATLTPQGHVSQIACRVSVLVDALNEVAESSEDNNAREAYCTATP